MLANQKYVLTEKNFHGSHFCFHLARKIFFLIAAKHAKPTKLKKHSLGKNHFNAAIWLQLKDFSIVPILRIRIVHGSH